MFNHKEDARVYEKKMNGSKIPPYLELSLYLSLPPPYALLSALHRLEIPLLPQRCAISLESDILELRMWSRRAKRLDRKSDKLRKLFVSYVSGYF